MSQTSMILNHLQTKPITAIEALNLYGCFRLSARIKDLRYANHKIITENIEVGSGKKIARYILIG